MRRLPIILAVLGMLLVPLPASAADGDGDGVDDTVDNCVAVPNPLQENTDAKNLDGESPANSGTINPGVDATNPHADTLGDACDPDDDNDGLNDGQEPGGCNGSGALSETNFDTDGDLFPDGYECGQGTKPDLASSRPMYPPTGATDSDSDGLNDAIEILVLTFGGPVNFDGGGCSDAKENASVNGDSLVNSADLSAVAQRFGMYRNATTGVVVVAKEIYDFNRDGTIASADLSTVAERFGNCAQTRGVNVLDTLIFNPAAITINTGDTVKWTWTGGAVHTVTSTTGAFNSGFVSGVNSTFSHGFTTPGTYNYYCQLHGTPEGVGMYGTVTVVTPSAP